MEEIMKRDNNRDKNKGVRKVQSGSRTKLGLIAQIYPISTIIAPTYTMTNINPVRVDIIVNMTRDIRLVIDTMRRTIEK